jgi:hypothetical protein
VRNLEFRERAWYGSAQPPTYRPKIGEKQLTMSDFGAPKHSRSIEKLSKSHEERNEGRKRTKARDVARKCADLHAQCTVHSEHFANFGLQTFFAFFHATK